MPLEFRLTVPIGGIALHAASPGEPVDVLTEELLGPAQPQLLSRLEELQSVVFSRIAGLPPPSMIDHLLLLIRPDLSGIAYVNELRIQAMVRVNRAVQAGTPVFQQDITEVSSVDLGVEVPADNAVVVVRSAGWRRSLYWNFGPLNPEHLPRTVPIEKVLAQQELLLLGLDQPASTSVANDS